MRAVIVALIVVFVAGSWIAGAAARQTLDQQQEVILVPGRVGPWEHTKADLARNHRCFGGQADTTGVACASHTAACGATLVRLWENSTLGGPLLKPFKLAGPLSGIATRPPRRPPKRPATVNTTHQTSTFKA